MDQPGFPQETKAGQHANPLAKGNLLEMEEKKIK